MSRLEDSMLWTRTPTKEETQELLRNLTVLLVFGRTFSSHTQPLFQMIVFLKFLLAVYPCFRSERS